MGNSVPEQKSTRRFVLNEKIMKIFQLLFFLSFVVFIIIKLVQQKKGKVNLYNLSISAKAIDSEKEYKGYFFVTLIENGKRKYISVSYPNDLRISIGDSLYKSAKSNTFYIKKESDSIFKKIDLIDASISKKWE
jgi:hypothetical protein